MAFPDNQANYGYGGFSRWVQPDSQLFTGTTGNQLGLSGYSSANTGNNLTTTQAQKITNNMGTDWMSTLFGEGAGLINSLGGLALGGMQAYTGLQNYKLAKQGLSFAKDQFKFQKGLANRNLANQAKVINNAYNNAAQVAGGLAGGSFGFVDPAIVQKYAEKAKEKHVSGEPI